MRDHPAFRRLTPENDHETVEQRLFATSDLHHSLNTTILREDLPAKLAAFAEAGLTTPAKVDEAMRWIEGYKRSEWKIVAPACVMCDWSLEKATELDDADDPESNALVAQIRDAAAELTDIVGFTLPSPAE